MTQVSEYRPKGAPGPRSVEIHEGEWIDPERGGRRVPWKVFLPGPGGGPAPAVIWSHGAGGTRHGGSYLGLHLASHGFAAVHIQHRGTDSEVMAGGRSQVLRAVSDPGASLDRFRDVAFTVKALDASRQMGPLADRVDVSRIGMSGHSFGAITTMIAAGQILPSPFGQSLAVPRIRAAMVMSPSNPRPGYRAERSYHRMLAPIFHMTGTDDVSPMADFPPSDRQIPFRKITVVDQYLLVLNGGNHATFTDRPRLFGRDYDYPERHRHQGLIKIAATAYWESRLKDDPAATRWLDGGGFASELGDHGTFEVKSAR